MRSDSGSQLSLVERLCIFADTLPQCWVAHEAQCLRDKRGFVLSRYKQNRFLVSLSENCIGSAGSGTYTGYPMLEARHQRCPPGRDPITEGS